jgi:GNAT superfamily N-acetyltransferase
VDVADTYQVRVRRPVADDQGYVASTWVKSLYTADKRRRMSDLNALVDRMLDEPTVRLLVACEPTDAERILGWVAFTPSVGLPVLHYVYVREKHRRHGIARQMANHIGLSGRFIYTLRGPDADGLTAKHPTAVHVDIHEFLNA